MRLAGLFLSLPRLAEQVRESRPLIGYSGELLHLRLNRVFDMPEVVVAPHRPATVNVLVPGFSVDTVSAGFFGVFALARQREMTYAAVGAGSVNQFACPSRFFDIG